MKKIICLLFLPAITVLTAFTHRPLTWVAVGDSITYLNDHLDETGNRLTKGYLTDVTEKLPYIHAVNQGHNGWTSGQIARAIDKLGLVPADVYTSFLAPMTGGIAIVSAAGRTMRAIPGTARSMAPTGTSSISCGALIRMRRSFSLRPCHGSILCRSIMRRTMPMVLIRRKVVKLSNRLSKPSGLSESMNIYRS